MNCEKAREHREPEIWADLDVAERRLVAEHLAVCGACSVELPEDLEITQAVRSLPAPHLPRRVTDTIMEQTRIQVRKVTARPRRRSSLRWPAFGLVLAAIVIFGADRLARERYQHGHEKGVQEGLMAGREQQAAIMQEEIASRDARIASLEAMFQRCRQEAAETVSSPLESWIPEQDRESVRVRPTEDRELPAVPEIVSPLDSDLTQVIDLGVSYLVPAGKVEPQEGRVEQAERDAESMVIMGLVCMGSSVWNSDFRHYESLAHPPAGLFTGKHQGGWDDWHTEAAEEDARSFQYFKSAAEQGEAKGYLGMALHYETGRGVAKDLVKAVECYQKAADHDIAVAQNNLGVLYERGLGVARDPKKALELYVAAGRLTEVPDIAGVLERVEGVIEASETDESGTVVRAVIVDLDDHQYEVTGTGERELRGLVGHTVRAYGRISGDTEKTLSVDIYHLVGFVEKESVNGSAFAPINLGALHESGVLTGSPDHREAFRAYNFPGRLASPHAQYCVARLLESGRGHAPDVERAKAFHRQACQNGHPPAKEALARLGPR